MLLTPLSHFTGNSLSVFPGFAKEICLGFKQTRKGIFRKNTFWKSKSENQPTNRPYTGARDPVCATTQAFCGSLCFQQNFTHMLNICKVKQSKQSVVGIKCAEIFMLTTYFMLTTLQPHMFQAIRSILPDSRNERCIPTLKMDQPLFIAFV